MSLRLRLVTGRMGEEIMVKMIAKSKIVEFLGVEC
jgi:hypothetical protein